MIVGLKGVKDKGFINQLNINEELNYFLFFNLNLRYKIQLHGHPVEDKQEYRNIKTSNFIIYIITYYNWLIVQALLDPVPLLWCTYPRAAASPPRCCWQGGGAPQGTPAPWLSGGRPPPRGWDHLRPVQQDVGWPDEGYHSKDHTTAYCCTMGDGPSHYFFRGHILSLW